MWCLLGNAFDDCCEREESDAGFLCRAWDGARCGRSRAFGRPTATSIGGSIVVALLGRGPAVVDLVKEMAKSLISEARI